MTGGKGHEQDGMEEGIGIHPSWVAWFVQHRRAVLGGIAGVSLLVALWDFDPRMDLWGDNAEFIVLARSIVQGQSMRLINEPDAPRSDKFPFGFPLLLAGVEALAPGNMGAMKALSVALYALAMPVLYRLLSRYLAPGPALAVTLLSLLNPLLLPFAHQVMSEVPYLLASLLTLLAFERAAEAGQRRALVGGALLALGATTLRVVGPSLCAGASLWYLARRQYRRALLVAGLYLGGLLALQLLGAGVLGSFYVHEAMKVNPYKPELGEVSVAQLPARVLGNLKAYGLAYAPKMIFPGLKIAPLNLVTAGLCLLGLIGGIMSRMLPSFYLVAYGAILTLWPSSMPQPRYLVPIIPLLLLYFFDGLSRAVSFILQRLRRLEPFAASLKTGILAIMIGIMITLYPLTLYRTRGEYDIEYSRGWKSYFEAAEWLKEHSPPDSLVITRKPFQVHLISLRKTMGFLLSPNPDEVIEEVRRHHATFVIVDSVRLEMSRNVIQTIEAHREEFELVYSTPNDRRPTYIYRVKD